MDLAVGLLSNKSGAPGTETETPVIINVNSTDDAPTAVFAAITTVTVVVLTTVHDMAAVPLLGVAPTLAVQANPRMKLVPVTVIALERNTAKGVTEMTSTEMAAACKETESVASALV